MYIGIVLYPEIRCRFFPRNLILQILILSQLQLKLYLHVESDNQACKLCTYLAKLRS